MEQQILISAISGLFGAILGGLATYISTFQTHKNNIKLVERKEFIEKRSVVLAIAAELTSLLDSYETEMDNLYKDLSNEQFLECSYAVTQDFMTIYNNNANKIGIIEDDQLRTLIIRSYTYLKRYIEYLLNYKEELESFINKRNSFIGLIYPEVIKTECATANTTLAIKCIKDRVSKNNWQHLRSGYLNEMQIKTFIESDEQAISDLKDYSNDLKNKYIELKKLFNETIDEISKQYGFKKG